MSLTMSHRLYLEMLPSSKMYLLFKFQTSYLHLNNALVSIILMAQHQ